MKKESFFENATFAQAESEASQSRKYLVFFAAALLLACSLLIAVSPAKAYAYYPAYDNDESLPVPPASSPVQTNTLTVNYVIDNVDEFPEAANMTFYFGYAPFTSWACCQPTGLPVKAPYYPNVSALNTFSVTASGSKVFTWAGRLYNGITHDSRPNWEKLKTAGTNYAVLYYDVPEKRDEYGYRKYTAYEDGILHYTFSPVDQTSGQLSLMYIDYGQGTTPSTYDNLGIVSLPCTPYNWADMVDLTGEITLHFRYTGGLPTVNLDYDAEMSGSKQIDYLGDGVRNPDTARDGQNDYRLYVTGSTGSETADNYRSKDIIFVLDVSNSMDDPFGGTAGNRRIDTLKTETRSMINKLSADSNNTFTVIQFATDAELLLNRGTAAEADGIVAGIDIDGGTDYYSALGQAAEILNNVTSNESIVVFVSDGQPTGVPEEILHATSGSADCTPVALPYAVMAAEGFPECKSFYSIYIGSDPTAPSMLQSVTQHVAVSGERASVSVEDPVEFAKVIDALTARLIRPATSVTLSDTLSENVVYRSGSAKMVKQEQGKDPETLVNGKDYSLTYDAATRTITAEVKDKSVPNTNYTLSFDVSASVRVVEKWIASKTYPDVGDEGTDYGDNQTSAGKEGFFSNDNGSVALVWEGGGKTIPLPKPVIQVMFEPEDDSEVKAHVTLHNMELSPNMFMYKLVDEQGNTVATAGNDMNGDIKFPRLVFDQAGVWNYTIEPIIPAPGESGWIEYMIYDQSVFKVKLTSVVSGDEEGAAQDVIVGATYESDPHFYNDYQLRTTYQ